jgi:hypothetical protein
MLGEAFATLHEAEAQAAVVADELGRNSSQIATVFGLSEDGELPARSAAVGNSP